MGLSYIAGEMYNGAATVENSQLLKKLNILYHMTMQLNSWALITEE